MLVSEKQSSHLENLEPPSVPGEEEGSKREELKKTSDHHQSLEKRAANGRSLWPSSVPGEEGSKWEELKKTSDHRQSLEKRAANGRSWRKPLTIISPWRRRGQQMGGAEENMWPPSASFEEDIRRSILEKGSKRQKKKRDERKGQLLLTDRYVCHGKWSWCLSLLHCFVILYA